LSVKKYSAVRDGTNPDAYFQENAEGQRDISVMEYPKGESGSEHRKGAKRIPGGGRECLGARGSAANTASGKALAMKGCPFAEQKV
jgi:hypothetical protein